MVMVEFLLQNSVNNVHKALSIARERNLDDIWNTWHWIGMETLSIWVDWNYRVINCSGYCLKRSPGSKSGRTFFLKFTYAEEA